jgi:hypothetical protein
VCLLINPGLERYYGSVSKDEVRRDLLGVGDQSGDTLRYGGGYPAEAVVPNEIAPHDIQGVLLSSHFVDKDLSAAFQEKVAALDPSTPNDYSQTFNDEINLLGMFGMVDDDMAQGMEYMRVQQERAQQLHRNIRDPHSATNIALESPPIAPEDMNMFGGGDDSEKLDFEEYRQQLVAKREQEIVELKAILADPQLRQYEDGLRAAGEQLMTTLHAANISTYSDLIVFLAKVQGIPVYDKSGSVIWPQTQGTQPAATEA